MRNKYLKTNASFIQDFNVIKGFLNLVIDPSIWLNYLETNWKNTSFTRPSKNEKVMVEYSSPNTNKPLHLGHVRNNLLGYSVAEILKASGNKVYKTQIINDRHRDDAGKQLRGWFGIKFISTTEEVLDCVL